MGETKRRKQSDARRFDTSQCKAGIINWFKSQFIFSYPENPGCEKILEAQLRIVDAGLEHFWKLQVDRRHVCKTPYALRTKTKNLGLLFQGLWHLCIECYGAIGLLGVRDKDSVLPEEMFFNCLHEFVITIGSIEFLLFKMYPEESDFYTTHGTKDAQVRRLYRTIKRIDSLELPCPRSAKYNFAQLVTTAVSIAEVIPNFKQDTLLPFSTLVRGWADELAKTGMMFYPKNGTVYQQVGVGKNQIDILKSPVRRRPQKGRSVKSKQ